MIGDFGTMWEEWLKSHPEITDEDEKHRCYSTFGRMYELMKLEEKYSYQNDVVDQILGTVEDVCDFQELRRSYGTLCNISSTLEHLFFELSQRNGIRTRELSDLEDALSKAHALANDARDLYSVALDSAMSKGKVNLRKADLSEIRKQIEKYRAWLEEEE